MIGLYLTIKDRLLTTTRKLTLPNLPFCLHASTGLRSRGNEFHVSGKAAEIVKAQIASGIYTDAAAFISDIVLKYETYYKKKLAALNRELAIGLEQANRGECVEFDFDELMQEVDEELGYTMGNNEEPRFCTIRLKSPPDCLQQLMENRGLTFYVQLNEKIYDHPQSSRRFKRHQRLHG
jgi:Arc/MetJ-type ribon-helix-helix transcriptional regulator